MHATELARAYALARGIPDASAADLARVFGLAGIPAFDTALPLPGVLGLPLRWTAEGPLAEHHARGARRAATAADQAASQAAGTGAARPLPGDPYHAFARALSSRAGIDDTTRLRAALGRPLTEVLRDLAAAAPARPDGSARLAPGNGPHPPGRCRRPDVRRASAPEPGRGGRAARRRPRPHRRRPADGATAADATADARPGILRTVAATVTLVEKRSKGESPAGEAVILALASGQHRSTSLRARAAHWRATGVRFADGLGRDGEGVLTAVPRRRGRKRQTAGRRRRMRSAACGSPRP